MPRPLTGSAGGGGQSALIATLSYFPELEAEIELLRSERNMVLMECQVDTLWILARPASDLLTSLDLPSVACGPPDDAGE
jgi:hypothetical protein